MTKIYAYFMGVLYWLSTSVCYAVDKFEILPDLPDPLAQAAQASTVSKTGDLSNVLGSQSVSSEPSVISVVISLLIVIFLIYVTGIIYAKLNKVGFNTLKKQQGDLSKTHISVVSTTALGNNKTLHVVELDGKRMLIGASSGAIQLIKDLGSYSNNDGEEEYSHIEIPNIKIPKIEIPKIEIPTIGLSKIITKAHKNYEKDESHVDIESSFEDISVETTEAIKPEDNSDGIIDSLFTTQPASYTDPIEENPVKEHMVDPDNYALHKKYLG